MNYTLESFIAKLRILGKKRNYIALVNRAQCAFDMQPLPKETVSFIVRQVADGITNGSPGHDKGHCNRELAGAVAIASNPSSFTLKFNPVERVAAILGGWLHDYANAYVKRYLDNETLYGHAEKGAFMVWEKLHGLIEENLLLLTCYAIAAHTHYAKEIQCTDGSIRLPYEYGIYQKGDKYYGLSVIFTRAADRSDATGPNHVARHTVAQADGAQTKGSQDFSAGQFFEVNKENLRIMMLPGAKTVNGYPSVLQHVSNFANSNFGKSIYSADDYLFPEIARLIGTKVGQYDLILASLPEPTNDEIAHETVYQNAINNFKSFLWHVSGSPHFNDAWGTLEVLFNSLNPKDRAFWGKLSVTLTEEYDKWVRYLAQTIGSSQDPIALIFQETALDLLGHIDS